MNATTSFDFILTAEAARLCGVSDTTIRLWQRRGKLEAARTTRGVRLFARADVEQLARERDRRAS